MNAVEIKTQAASCEKHGDFTSRHLFGTRWSGCPKCAQEQEAERRAERDAEERAAKVLAWQKQIGRAGIPERFRGRTFENFQAESGAQKTALAFAKGYAEAFSEAIKTGKGALFIGKPGTGKTHLAAAIGMHLLANGHPVLFTTVMRAIRRIKDSWSKASEETESQAIASLVFPDLLILDEVGVQFGTEFERNVLFDVLNERYERRLPTLLMSNLPLEEVKGYLGVRVFDRMREDGGQYIPFEWESHRGKGAA